MRMNCLWGDGEQRHLPGWRIVICRRCGIRSGPSPHPHERIYSRCQAWPFWWEYGHWVTLWLEVFGLSKERWKWLLRKLNLLPPKGCGCEAREIWLDSLGGKVNATVCAAWQRLRRLFRFDHP